VLGFPIRTPPDHSLVANSPGLIAGSNVLHRLLMPRHPPCALHSLSQQRQNNTHQPTPQSRGRRHKQHNPLKERRGCANRNYIQPPPKKQRGSNKLQRCSRPLCRSQTTTPPTPTSTQHAPTGEGRHHRWYRSPARTLIPTADPSGPNSVFNHVPTNVRPMTKTPSQRPSS
jgi:hypothetical protein